MCQTVSFEEMMCAASESIHLGHAEDRQNNSDYALDRPAIEAEECEEVE